MDKVCNPLLICTGNSAHPILAEGLLDGKATAFDLAREAIGYRLPQLLQLPLEQMQDGELQAGLTAMVKS